MIRPKLPVFLVTISLTSNHATGDVHSPKAVKTLMNWTFYEYFTHYLVQNVLSFSVIEQIHLKVSIECIKSNSFML